MEAIGPEGGGNKRRRRRLTLLLDEIVELFSLSLTMLALNGGQFLRINVDAISLSDRNWVSEISRLQREEGCTLALQVSVISGGLDLYDPRFLEGIAALRTVNAYVVARSGGNTPALNVDALADAGVAYIISSVETLCALAVGARGSKALTEVGHKPPAVGTCARNLATTKELDIARALRCHSVDGRLFGEGLNAAQAQQVVSRLSSSPRLMGR